MPQIYDMGPTALLPLRRKACWGFFRPKNPTASAGFEPANVGTKGQHATPRPPKPISIEHKIPKAHNLHYSDNQLVLTGTTDFIGVITAVIFTITPVWCSDTLEVLACKFCRTAGLILGVAELPLIRTITTIIVMVTQPALPENVR